MNLASFAVPLSGNSPHTHDTWALRVTSGASDGSVAPLLVASNMAKASVEFARPANTTAYAAKDVIGPAVAAVLTFANLARVNGGSGYIVKARLMTNLSTMTARCRLHLYHTAPAAIADNDPFALLYANRANRVGFIDFDALATEGAGSDAASALNGVARLSFGCAANSRALVGVLTTLDAATPASGQSFFVELEAEVN